jgi:hypothetical protein
MSATMMSGFEQTIAPIARIATTKHAVGANVPKILWIAERPVLSNAVDELKPAKPQIRCRPTA